MTEPVKLESLQRKPDQQVIDLLKDLLGDAERGELLSVTYFGEMTGGRTVSDWGGSIQRVPNIMFALQSVLHRMMRWSDSE